jgi:HD-GYP domain-containing protein (c-di-GMP phosphodiesterase class II)
MQLAVAVEIEHTIRLVDCSQFVSLSEKIGRDITSFIAANNVLPRELFRIARHDFNTFAHVTNVAGYCVVLAECLGISDRGELEQIATAAMLHDIGKRFIPASILTKPGRLAPAERDAIEMHPTRGYEELCERSDLSVGQLMMVYQHHERIDGGGYPVGVEGHDIHPWARMLAVVDVFDAMTGKRSYRNPASSRDALNYILRNSGTHFDREIAQCWVSAMNKT